MDVMLLGKKLGTASGWDEAGPEVGDLAFYDFKPVEKCSIPACGCLNIFLGSGIVQYSIDDDWKKFGTVNNIIEVLSKL